ncbi:MAG: hypothetical protein JWR27_1337 [Aeromicrobium sp.]|nr:hypothetical protein [Aeromicrobium sp.]
MTNVLLVAVDPQIGDRVGALPGHWTESIDRGSAAHVARFDAGGSEFEPDIIFVGSGMSVDNALEYARVVLEQCPGMVMVLVGSPNRALARRAKKAGFRDVVRSSVPDRELQSLIDGAASVVAAPEGGPVVASTEVVSEGPHQVVVVASPKGGVGKTTTAVVLAATLAAASPWEVALLDLDLQFGDVSSVLDLQPEHTVTDAFVSGGSDSMRVRTLLTTHASGFYVLAGANGPAENGHVTGDQVRKLISQLSASFRHVVIDTSAGLMEETLSSLEEATDLVLVTALDVATLRAARKEIDVLADLSLLPSARHVVLNRADRRAGLTVRDAERILGLSIDAVVPMSDKVVLAANHGYLADVATKKSEVRKAFQSLAHTIAGVAHVRHGLRGERLS